MLSRLERWAFFCGVIVIMDNVDFNFWLNRYRMAFANVNKLFINYPDLSKDWFKALKYYTLDELDDARFKILTSAKSPYAGEHLGKLIEILKSKAPPASWATPTPEQMYYSDEEDAEIEEMIQRMVTPRLQAVCRRVLKMQHYEVAI